MCGHPARRRNQGGPRRAEKGEECGRLADAEGAATIERIAGPP